MTGVSWRTYHARMKLSNLVILSLFVVCACAETGPAGSVDATIGADSSSDGVNSSPDEDTASDSDVSARVTNPGLNCTGQCSGKACGPDGCGGSCGSCDEGEACNVEGACVPYGDLAPLGGPCGPQADCQEDGENWPDCLDAQCATGLCRFPVCTMACAYGEDAINNHDASPYPDGVQDPHLNTCDGAVLGPLGSEYHCVNLVPPGSPPAGTCLAGTTFAYCTTSGDCPEGEECSLLQVGGVTELRCIRGLDESVGVGEYCEEVGALDEVCVVPDLCSSDGCTAACLEDSECMPPETACVDGYCSQNPDLACEEAVDCSPWTCRLLDEEEWDDSGLRGVCEPRVCQASNDCRDDRYVCELRLGSPANFQLNWAHVCVLPSPDANQVVGGPCSNDVDSEFRCPVSDLCYKGVCTTLCTEDQDCADVPEGLCAVVELPLNLDEDPELDGTLSLRVCESLASQSPALTSCSVDADCSEQGDVCAPVELPAMAGLSLFFQIQNYCRAMPDSFGSYGDSCGLLPGEGECKMGFCAFGASEEDVAALCSQLCTSSESCPDVTVDGVVRPSFCRAVVYGWNDTKDPGDDLYSSVCWPAPQGSSLGSCEPLGEVCPEGEVCTSTFQAGDPYTDASVEWLCMKRPENAGEAGVGQACELNVDCASGVCLDGPDGERYCSAFCEADVDCLAGGPTMICEEYEAIPRYGAADAVVKQCRKAETCVPCLHHNDCAGGMRCMGVGADSSGKFACAHPCVTDSECLLTDGDDTCKEGTTPDGTAEFTCAPASCAL